MPKGRSGDQANPQAQGASPPVSGKAIVLAVPHDPELTPLHLEALAKRPESPFLADILSIFSGATSAKGIWSANSWLPSLIGCRHLLTGDVPAKFEPGPEWLPGWESTFYPVSDEIRAIRQWLDGANEPEKPDHRHGCDRPVL